MKAAVVLPKRLIYQSDLASVPENRTPFRFRDTVKLSLPLKIIFHSECFKPEFRRLADDGPLGQNVQGKQVTRLCLTTTYFHLESGVYEQVEGVAVVYHLSPVLANIYNSMQDFEQKTMTTLTSGNIVTESCNISSSILNG